MAGIPSDPVLLVSPHLDDAVLSCSAVIDRGEAVDVLTVFAGSPDPPQRGWWDAECGFESSAESMPARLLEDEAAFAGLPHRRRHLPLLELQYVAGDRPTSDLETIAAQISSWVSENPSGTVAVPAGAGCRAGPIVARVRRLLGRPCEPPQHPDHLYVRDIALSLRTPAMLLYEELPYLFGGEAPSVADDGWHVEPLVVPIDRSVKAARIAAYASQVPRLSPPGAPLDEADTLPPVERYWLLRRSSSPA